MRILFSLCLFGSLVFAPGNLVAQRGGGAPAGPPPGPPKNLKILPADVNIIQVMGNFPVRAGSPMHLLSRCGRFRQRQQSQKEHGAQHASNGRGYQRDLSRREAARDLLHLPSRRSDTENRTSRSGRGSETRRPRTSLTRRSESISSPSTHGSGGRLGIHRKRYRRKKSVGVRTVFEPCQLQNRSAAVLARENVIFVLKRSLDVETPRIRLQTRNLRCDVLRKEELSGMRHMTIHVHFHMNMDGAALIPSRVERHEFGHPLLAGSLHTAQKSRRIDPARAWRRAEWGRAQWRRAAPSTGVACREAGVNTQSVAMPDIERRILKRRASSRIDESDPQP